MRVRLLFYCPHCGSLLFRPSQSRMLRDSFLSPFGVHPQRCQMCRLRFYLFKPNRLRSLLSVPQPEFQPQQDTLEPAVESGRRPLLGWHLLRQNASDIRRNP